MPDEKVAPTPVPDRSASKARSGVSEPETPGDWTVPILGSVRTTLRPVARRNSDSAASKGQLLIPASRPLVRPFELLRRPKSRASIPVRKGVDGAAAFEHGSALEKSSSSQSPLLTNASIAGWPSNRSLRLRAD
jgi:hypothetical protein